MTGPVTMTLDETEVIVFPDGRALVASAGQPGEYHTVGADGRCSCAGYRHRRRCRHLLTALAARQRRAWGGLPGLGISAARLCGTAVAR